MNRSTQQKERRGGGTRHRRGEKKKKLSRGTVQCSRNGGLSSRGVRSWCLLFRQAESGRVKAGKFSRGTGSNQYKKRERDHTQ